jgi:hypothetical protein
MSRKTEIKKLPNNSKMIIRDKQYYFNTLDIEHDLLKKAADIAERMMVAFMRENKVEVSLDPEDLANRIAEKLGKRVYHPVEYSSNNNSSNLGGFNYDDGPVIIKTEKIEVKGSVTTTNKTKDSIKENIDLLDNLEI